MNAHPPALMIRLELEARPRLHLDVGSSDDELRLRDHVAANRARLLSSVEAALDRIIGDPQTDTLLDEAAAVVVRGTSTVRDVVERAAAGDPLARAWLAWAWRNLDDSKQPLASILLYLEHCPDLMADVAAESAARDQVDSLGDTP